MFVVPETSYSYRHKVVVVVVGHRFSVVKLIVSLCCRCTSSHNNCSDYEMANTTRYCGRSCSIDRTDYQTELNSYNEIGRVVVNQIARPTAFSLLLVCSYLLSSNSKRFHSIPISVASGKRTIWTLFNTYSSCVCVPSLPLIFSFFWTSKL